MVVFTCLNCNASLKRAVVEKHYATACKRNPVNLTCIDCLKDFDKNNYQSHTACVTEAERYGDKTFKPKPTGLAQDKWMEIVHFCAKKNNNPRLNNIFNSLTCYSNVPRKKTKFLNFIKCSLPKSVAVSNEVFDIIEKEFNHQKNMSTNEQNGISENMNNSNEASNGKQSKDETEKVENEREKKKDKKKSSMNGKCENASNNPTINDYKKHRRKRKDERMKVKFVCSLSENELKELQSGNFRVLLNMKPDDKQNNKKMSGKNGKCQNVSKHPISDRKKISQSRKNGQKQPKFIHFLSKDQLYELKSGNANGESAEEGTVQENPPNAEDDQSENIEKLSKKQLKKLKKKQKYEKELLDIESSNFEESADISNKTADENNDQDLKKASKKHKKRKATVSESEADTGKRQKIKDINEIESLDQTELEEKQNTELEEKQNGVKVKFNWEEVIKEVLLKSSDHEMSLKRVAKKVLAEYQSLKGDSETYEKLISKFNKKINKTIGVRVLKDRAKLICVE